MRGSKVIKTKCLLGAHFSIAKGLHNALLEAEKYGCSALQLFTKNANTWKEKSLLPEEIERFVQTKIETGIEQIATHTSYLINLAADDQKKQALSCHALEMELIRSSQLRIPYVVLHPGSHMGQGEEAGIRKIAENVNKIFDKNPDLKTRLLFETTAGQGTNIGHTFEQIASIMDRIQDRGRVGVCLDTSHIFAAGYDIRTESAYRKTIHDFDSTVGLEQIFVIHLNDSKKELGTRVDRHENIGEGTIGNAAFAYIMNERRFQKVPKIIETPKQKGDKDSDRINLDQLRSFLND